MKYFILWIMSLCIASCLLTGCTETPNDTTVDSTGSSSIGNSESAPSNVQLTEPTQNTEGLLEELVIPSSQEKYFDLLCENCSMNFYLKNAGWQFVTFFVVYTEDLEGETLTITTNLGRTAEITITNYNDALPFTRAVFATYQGISWADVAAGDPTCQAQFQQYQGALDAIVDTLPKLKCYLLPISFKQLGIDTSDITSELTQITTITATMGEETKTYDVGEINFWNLNYRTKPGGGLYIRGGEVAGLNMPPSATGAVSLPAVSFFAKEDVTLQKLEVFGSEDVAISDVRCTILTESGQTYNMTWDGNSPLEIDAGTELKIELELEDPAVANTLSANVMRYFLLSYMKGEEECQVGIQESYLVFSGRDDIYALKVDGIDMLSYYLDYYNVASGR